MRHLEVAVVVLVQQDAGLLGNLRRRELQLRLDRVVALWRHLVSGVVQLDLPKGQDVPVGLRFGGEPSPEYRVQIFLNGWNVGQYGGDIGPQKDFSLPAGLLNERGTTRWPWPSPPSSPCPPALARSACYGNGRVN
ncbi:beta galactosidase jelly roll domain-containing protein [Nonomuraea basaltis]|uniref:beta galactosidase jelly roll domain-containing protein n=1 Tax=Nonomuraea basaltis TaxID=2495887 RepID=UPI0023F246A9|nr:beta galactosidase jelly roll domain-containing protein [Nonomuraea basaltis]